MILVFGFKMIVFYGPVNWNLVRMAHGEFHLGDCLGQIRLWLCLATGFVGRQDTSPSTHGSHHP